MPKSRLLTLLLLSVSLVSGSLPVLALPTGWEVQSGDVRFEQAGNVLNVTSTSQRAVVQYVSFNLASGETINFILPNAGASILNSVIGGQMSSIAGTINSNGQIAIVNQAGIHVANSAQINALGLLASTLKVDTAEYLNSGKFQMDRNGANPNMVINEGLINIGNGGYAVLAGSAVGNSGVVIAPDGQIHLAVGDKITVHLSNNTTLEVTVDEAVKETITELNAAIQNHGILAAGTVEMKAKLSGQLLASAVNNTGYIEAATMTQQGGKISIRAASSDGGSTIVSNTGTLNVSGDGQSYQAGSIVVDSDIVLNKGNVLAIGGAGQMGGYVELTGDQIMQTGKALIDVSGDTGGGTALIGGDFQGTGTTRRAVMNYAGKDVSLKADAGTSGNGGKLITWSDESTYFYGNVSAKGGAQSGNGGLAEVSGKGYLDFLGEADLTAAHGSKGTLLLDPTDITIYDWTNASSITVLGGTGPRSLFDANTGITKDGSNRVSAWGDQAGAADNATQGTAADQPLWVDNAYNGQDIVRFDGTTEELDGTFSGGLGALAGNTDKMIYAVGKRDTANSYDVVFDLGQSAAASAFGLNFRNDGNTIRTNQYGSGNDFDGTTGSFTNAGLNVWTAWKDTTGATSVLGNEVNNTSSASAVMPNANVANNAFRIGNVATGTNQNFDGDIGEIVLFDRMLSSDEQDLMSQHFNAKWGVNQNLTLSNLSVITDDYLEYLSTTANVSLTATNNITFNNQADNLIGMGDADTGGGLTLSAGNQIIFSDTNDVLRTEGGAINFSATNGMTLGKVNTTGAGGAKTGNITLSSSAGDISTTGLTTLGTVSITTSAGANNDVSISGSAITGTTTIQARGTITGSGNTFTGATNFDANFGTAYAINIGTSNFVNATNVFDGAAITLNDNAGATFGITGLTATGNATISTASGTGLSLATVDVTGATDIQLGGGNADVSGSTSLVFRGATNIDTNDDTTGDITLSGDFQGATTLYGDLITLTDTAGDLNVVNIITGNTGNSSLTNNVVNGDISVNVNDLKSGAQGKLLVTANKDITFSNSVGGWSFDDYVVLNSTNAGNILLDGVSIQSNFTAATSAYNINSVGQGIWASTNGGSVSVLNYTTATWSTFGVDVTTNNAAVTLGTAAKPISLSGTTRFIAGTADAIGYGSYAGNAAGTAGRIGITASTGNFTAGTVGGTVGLTASSGTGFTASDESLVIQTFAGDILGSGYTANGAANLRLQAGSSTSALTTNAIDVSNVSAAQNLKLYATGENSNVSIDLDGTSNVVGHITATGLNSSNVRTGTTGTINISLASGDLTTAYVWSESTSGSINLTTTNGSILQNLTPYSSLNQHSKTIWGRGAINLTAQGGASRYINTGVMARSYGSGGTVTAKASGDSAGNGTGTSVQLYGRANGNLIVSNLSNGNVTGNVYMGTDLGVIDDTEDVYTVFDTFGTTNIKATGAINYYGRAIGAMTLVGASTNINLDIGDATFASVNTTQTTGNAINVAAYSGSVLGSSLTSAGTSNIVLQAGNNNITDANKYVNLSGVNAGGNITVVVAGSTTANSGGQSVVITGTKGGTSSATRYGGGATLGSVSMP